MTDLEKAQEVLRAWLWFRYGYDRQSVPEER